ncbi:MAG: hypothetical protein M5U10_13560 [Candidatus Methanoperedens sp.]|nr:hypothetical protein [Candidatus Methanoperedens nitroreducens]MDJ1422930.1 hypothetical protein [Candidatus Methanoperedens sp.]
MMDSSTNLDIEPGEMNVTQYRCLDCKSTFRAIGKKVSCPSCQSDSVKKI